MKFNILDKYSKHDRLNVVYFSHSSFFYGSEQSLFDVVVMLRDNYNVNPLVVLPWKGRFGQLLQEHNISYLVTAYMPWWVSRTKKRGIIVGPIKWIWNLFSWLLVKKQVVKFKPDLVYINTLVTPCGCIAAQALGVPMVWHAREFIPKWLQRDYDFGRSWSLGKVSKSQAIICNSVAVKDDLTPHIPAEKCHVVYNGIHLERFMPLVDEAHLSELGKAISHPINLLMVGSIRPNKGQIIAFECLYELRKRGIYARLTLVGEEKREYGNELRKFSSRFGIDDLITWEGWQDDPKPFYQNADVTLVCSQGEPFGRTIIESMAQGTPVICSSSGGAPEIIRKVDSTLLFNQEDSESLATAIINLSRNPDHYKNIMDRGWKVVEDEFDVDIYTNKIYHIISAAVKSRGG